MIITIIIKISWISVVFTFILKLFFYLLIYYWVD